MQAVVEDIGHAMVELDLRDEKAVALNRCKYDLAHAVVSFAIALFLEYLY
jgi:hypothetical protein